MTLESGFRSGAILHPREGARNSVDLFQAIARLCGVRSIPGSEPVLEIEEAIGVHDHYLFVLVDGLGMNQLDRVAGGFFSAHLSAELRSVYPSTTAVALTSLATATWPVFHGITGWHTHFPELGRTITPLRFEERLTRVPAGELGISIDQLIPGRSLLPSYTREASSVIQREFCKGVYAVWSRGGTAVVPFGSLEQAVRRIVRLIRRASGPTFTHLYLTSVDSRSHGTGTMSDAVGDEIRNIDRGLSRLREKLPPEVRMIVTADHGLVNVPDEKRYILGPEDELVRQLMVPPSGEGRNAVFHVRPDALDAFPRAFHRHPLSQSFVLVDSAKIAQTGLLGPGKRSPGAGRHWGDFTAVALEPAVIEYVPTGGSPLKHRASHGGMDPNEMRVPLFVA